MDRPQARLMGRRNARIVESLQHDAMAASNPTGPMLGSNLGSISVSHSPGGMQIDQDSFRYTGFTVQVVIVKNGPNGETSNDYRYYAREVYLLQGDSSSIDTTVQLWIRGGGFWGLVYSTSEIPSGSHLLHEFDAGSGTDDIQVTDKASVVLTATEGDGVVADSGGGGYVFSVEVPTASLNVRGFITGNATGGGKYVGKSYITIATGDASASGDLASLDIGTLSSTVNCIIFNASEVGLADGGHYLTATQNTENFAIYFEGTLIKTNSDGTLVVLIDKQWAGCGDDLYTGAAPSDFVDGSAVD